MRDLPMHMKHYNDLMATMDDKEAVLHRMMTDPVFVRQLKAVAKKINEAKRQIGAYNALKEKINE